MNIPKMNSLNTDELKRKGIITLAKLIRTKNANDFRDTLADQKKPPPKPGSKSRSGLNRCLTTLDLTSLGVGSCVGTGMYLVAGMVAKKYAGPAVIFSFTIAAIASIFSGVCYAEFGVRVPYTTGSAYMYSYVTVGEFIAFIIGWNMVLEYLIGSSACACALSASIDALTNGAISGFLSDTIGNWFGSPPDLVAFSITLLMTLLLVAGVRKSLYFSNCLNIINLSVWAFIMTAGLFYIDTDNWALHGGFMPNGWSGVLTGAATCFYAFIGFDIIATTGEETIDPKTSIPRAIVGSLLIILTAYVTSGMMLTLIVPYDTIDTDSALVEMFAQRGSQTAKSIVAVGALAGLTVSMFGSMFPMPRVVFAMAKDGLIFKTLGDIFPLTNTPAKATLIFGLFAALAALLIKLEILVEMMSIGTLLAYTLVSTCVLILRYQPEKETLVEFLPDALRAQCDAAGNHEVKSGSHQTVKIRKPASITGSPDNEETAFGYGANQAKKITQQQMESAQHEIPLDETQASYGSINGASLPTESVLPPWVSEKMRNLPYLCPAIFPWKDRGEANESSGMQVMKLVGFLYIAVVVFDYALVCDIGLLEEGSVIATVLMLILLGCIIACLLLISRKPQNKKTLQFLAPGLPFVPGVAITFNIYLIFKLHILTLVRFTIWMIIGMIVYFKYGIKNSTLETMAPSQTYGQSAGGTADGQGADGIATYGYNDGYNNTSAPEPVSQPAANQYGNPFPTWDDDPQPAAAPVKRTGAAQYEGW